MKMAVIGVTSCVLLCLANASFASPIVIGSGAGPANLFPFSSTYRGEYQQVYAATAFLGPLDIAEVAFASDPNPSGVAKMLLETFTVSLGTTSSTPSSPGSFASNKGADFTQVFSGKIVSILRKDGSFDFVINFSQTFAYDPSQGNLLLDVVLESGRAVPAFGDAFFAAGASTDIGRIYSGGAKGPNYGLLTRFSDVQDLQNDVPVPEPATLLLMCISLAAAGQRLSRRKSRP
jgi:hypothetical protein